MMFELLSIAKLENFGKLCSEYSALSPAKLKLNPNMINYCYVAPHCPHSKELLMSPIRCIRVGMSFTDTAMKGSVCI